MNILKENLIIVYNFFFLFEFINEYNLKKFKKMFLIGCDIYFKVRDMLIMKINLWNISNLVYS